MTKINTFDRAKVRNLRIEIAEALKDLSAKHGINLTVGNARYDSSYVKLQLEGAIISDGVVKSKERIALEHYYPQYVDKQITLSTGLMAKVIGYNSRAKKYPFIAETLGRKKRYKLSEWSIR